MCFSCVRSSYLNIRLQSAVILFFSICICCSLESGDVTDAVAVAVADDGAGATAATLGTLGAFADILSEFVTGAVVMATGEGLGGERRIEGSAWAKSTSTKALSSNLRRFGEFVTASSGAGRVLVLEAKKEAPSYCIWRRG